MNPELDRIQNDITMLFIRIDELRKEVLEAIAKTQEQTTLTVPRPAEEKKQYPAVCCVCGQACSVPFKPNENANIKCKQCWLKAKETA